MTGPDKCQVLQTAADIVKGSLAIVYFYKTMTNIILIHTLQDGIEIHYATARRQQV